MEQKFHLYDSFEKQLLLSPGRSYPPQTTMPEKAEVLMILYISKGKLIGEKVEKWLRNSLRINAAGKLYPWHGLDLHQVLSLEKGPAIITNTDVCGKKFAMQFLTIGTG